MKNKNEETVKKGGHQVITPEPPNDPIGGKWGTAVPSKNQQNNEGWEKKFKKTFLKKVEKEGCQAFSELCGIKDENGKFKCQYCQYWNGQDRYIKKYVFDEKEVKEYIRQQRQEAVEEYREEMSKQARPVIVKVDKQYIDKACEKAVRKFAEDVGRYLRMDWERVKKWNRSANSYNIEDSLNSLKTALEVYEGK